MKRFLVAALALAPLTALAAPTNPAAPPAIRKQIRANAKQAGYLKPGSGDSIRTWVVSPPKPGEIGMISGNVWSTKRMVVGAGLTTGPRKVVATAAFITKATAQGPVVTESEAWTPRLYTK